jgi:ligand-binding SRPBCC domain-containing protein
MGIHTIEQTQFFAVDIETLWDFITSPANLQKITPGDLSFEITSKDAVEKIYPGKIITYKISPFPGIKFNWITEITHIQHGQFFIDEQRSGPYAIWHHEHHLAPVAGGVNMIDKIYYKVPGGILGDLINVLWVRKKLRHIFEFRRQKLSFIFGEIH